MITEFDITEAQIIALRLTLDWDEQEGDVIICDVALGMLSGATIGGYRYNRGTARQHCARLLNAREAARRAS